MEATESPGEANGVCCSNCIRSCPFNKPAGWIHGAARSVVRARVGWLNRALVWFDGLCGYGREVRLSLDGDGARPAV
ncbi:MAG: hypothetical protein NTW86_16850 [Candidatus Sumerlaeota bacterium]|nr:hypothetical protein [Candidatus Sumerlaeota bacterium]